MTAKPENRAIICQSADVENGGLGICFEVMRNQQQFPAFVIRHKDTAYAYLNQCAHLFLELDWDRGEFFDLDETYIICANHGALFEPHTGLCVSGPCYGRALIGLSVVEQDEQIVLQDNHYTLANDTEDN